MKKRCYLDSNIATYLIDKKSSFHVSALQLLDHLIEQNYYFVISPLVVDEFLYAIRNTFFQQGKKELEIMRQLKHALTQLLSLSGLEMVYPIGVLQEHGEVVSLMERYTLSPRDAYHLFAMYRNDVHYLATGDTDFTKKDIQGITIITWDTFGINTKNV